jgi:hypothetical protein
MRWREKITKRLIRIVFYVVKKERLAFANLS